MNKRINSLIELRRKQIYDVIVKYVVDEGKFGKASHDIKEKSKILIQSITYKSAREIVKILKSERTGNTYEIVKHEWFRK